MLSNVKLMALVFTQDFSSQNKPLIIATVIMSDEFAGENVG